MQVFSKKAGCILTITLAKTREQWSAQMKAPGSLRLSCPDRHPQHPTNWPRPGRAPASTQHCQPPLLHVGRGLPGKPHALPPPGRASQLMWWLKRSRRPPQLSYTMHSLAKRLNASDQGGDIYYSVPLVVLKNTRLGLEELSTYLTSRSKMKRVTSGSLDYLLPLNIISSWITRHPSVH